MRGPRTDLVLIACRCADLSWDTVETILIHRRGDRPSSRQAIDTARNEFEGLGLGAARKTLEAMAVFKS